MAWIKSHQELRNHPKVARLASLLNISKPAVIGHLHLLWWWSLDYAPDGNLSNFSLEEIQDAMLFEKKIVARINILETLIKSGFIDNNLVIHDWFEYAGDLLEKKAKHAQKMREYRSQQKPTNNHVLITCQSRDEIDRRDKIEKIDNIIKYDGNNKYPLINSLLPILSKLNKKSFTDNEIFADACETTLQKVKTLTGDDNFVSEMEQQINWGNNPVTLKNSVNPVKDLNVYAGQKLAYLLKGKEIEKVKAVEQEKIPKRPLTRDEICDLDAGLAYWDEYNFFRYKKEGVKV